MTTRKIRNDAAKAAFRVLIYEICEQEFRDPITQGLLTLIGSLDIRAVMTLNNSDLDTMQYIHYKDEHYKIGTEKPLLKSHVSLVKAAIQYNRYKISVGEEIDSSWSNIDIDDWENFRVNIYFSELPLQDVTTRSIGKSSLSKVSTVPNTEAESFQRSIKKDPTLYMDLQDISQFDKWHRNTTSLSKMQDVDDVLNPK